MKKYTLIVFIVGMAGLLTARTGFCDSYGWNDHKAASEDCIQVQDTSKSFKIGDKVPDFVINNVVNYKKTRATLGDFKSKLLILDFWATYCVPCLKLLPHYDSLQHKFGDQLQIFLVSREPAGKVTAFLNRNHYSMPSATSDEFLTHLFKHVGIPHEVWIKDGKMIATSFGDDVNESTIDSALNNRVLKMDFKEDAAKWDASLPLMINGNGGNGQVCYLSLITPYLPGVRPSYGFTKNSDRILSIYTNTTVAALYQQAFSHIDPLLNFDNRLILQVPDSLKRKLDRPDNVNSTEWMKGNSFCYNVVLPPDYHGNIGELMVRELNNFFYARFGISAHLKKHTIDCLVLGRTTNGHSPGYAGENPLLEADDHHFKMIGYRMEAFISFLGESLQTQTTPLIDETGFRDLIDVNLNVSLNDLAGVQKELVKSGLSLTVQSRNIDMIVISKGEPLTK